MTVRARILLAHLGLLGAAHAASCSTLCRLASQSKDEPIFVPDEFAQLQRLFGLSEASLNTVLEACAYGAS